MRILYINHYAGSPRHGMEFRPFYLAREWVRLGHEVRIVASAQSHLRREQPQLGGRDRLDEEIDGVRYTWFAGPGYAGNGSARVRNMASFVLRVYKEGRKLAAITKPEVVIASSTYPMDIWPAHRIAQLAGARLVFEIHDLWPLTPMELGRIPKWHPFIMLLQAAEHHAYRHADAVVSMLPKVHEHVRAHGLALDKLHVVPNGIDPDEWSSGQPGLPPGVRELLAKLRAAKGAIVGYAGNHGVSNALDTLLGAAKLLRDDRVSFVLAGSGPEKARLQHLAQDERLQNVVFVDPLPKAQVPALLSTFDIAYIGWRRQALYRFGIAPNKLMDYMMAARPVLHAVEAGNDAVGEARCGLTVAPEDPGATALGIRRLVASSLEEREAMGRRGREFVLENLTYPILAKKFLAACGGSAILARRAVPDA